MYMYSYGIQSTSVVTMAMKVLHNTCNMHIHDLPDMNGLNESSLEPAALGLRTYVAFKSLMPMLQLLPLCTLLSRVTVHMYNSKACGHIHNIYVISCA